VNARARRLADFQQGRAPELAVLAGSQAPGARVSMLERRRQALAGRDGVIGGEAAQAHAGALVGEAVAALGAALADALGPARCPVCRCCKRAIGRDRRTCPHCGAKDAASAPWPLKAEDLNMPQADAA
jgi:hypothetical protein